VFAWEIHGDGSGRELDWKAVQQGWNQKGLMWLHLHFEHPTSNRWLLEQSGIEESLLPYLLSDDSRPGAVVHEDRLILIMRGINANTDEEPEDLITLRLYLAPDQIISMRRRRVLTMQAIHQELVEGRGVRNASQFLIEVVSRIVERIGDHVETLEAEVSQLEQQLLNDETEGLRAGLQEIQSDLIDLRRYLHPQRLMFGKLLDVELDWLDAGTYNRIRTQVEFHTRHVEDIDYCWQRTHVIKEDLNTRQSEQLNQKLYLLAVVSGVFLPLTLITGLLGVNLAGIPMADNPAAFTVVSAGMLGIAGIILVYFKRKRWF
jgi:zinc transporter